MRIVGEVSHPEYKITLFHMNNRYSIKIENGQYEQTYKLRESANFQSVADVKQIIDSAFLMRVQQHFKELNQTLSQALERIEPKKENEFDEII